MILTVTLNPAIDKFYKVNELKPKTTIRVNEVVNMPGGKGINASRVAVISGYKSSAMGFLGGQSGELFESLITEKGIDMCFTKTNAQTRFCVNVWDEKENKSTELLEPGSEVTTQDVQNFLKQYEEKLPLAKVVTLCGSVPKGVSEDFYAKLIDLANKYNKPVILDTSGQYLKHGVGKIPYMIKPNEHEIKQLLNIDVKNMQQLTQAAKTLQKSGIGIVAVSLGKDGVLVVCESGVYKGNTPDIKVVNTVGCGDSMVAGFAIGIGEKWSIEKTMQFALATSTANAMHHKAGYFEQKDFDEIYPMCTVQKLDDL